MLTRPVLVISIDVPDVELFDYKIRWTTILVSKTISDDPRMKWYPL